MGNRYSIEKYNNYHIKKCTWSTCLHQIDIKDNTIVECNRTYHQECFFKHIQAYETYLFSNNKNKEVPLFVRPKIPNIF